MSSALAGVYKCFQTSTDIIDPKSGEDIHKHRRNREAFGVSVSYEQDLIDMTTNDN